MGEPVAEKPPDLVGGGSEASRMMACVPAVTPGKCSVWNSVF